MQPGPDRVRRRPRWSRRAVLAACLMAGPVVAATTAALGDFADILPNLPADARVVLQQRAAHWMNWSAGERDAFAVRLKDWEALPAADRGGQRERYAAWRALTPAERTDVQSAMQRYATLPADEQLALHREYEALDRSQQRGWLLGPVLGADYAVLQPLLAQLPPEEHRAMLQVLRTMAPQQRADLSVLVQRTPPHERAQLRRELQAAAPINRDDWLRTRLAR